MGVRVPPNEVGLHMTDLLEGSGDGPMTGDVRLESDTPHDIGLGGISAINTGDIVGRKGRRLKGGRSIRGLLIGVAHGLACRIREKLAIGQIAGIRI